MVALSTFMTVLAACTPAEKADDTKITNAFRGALQDRTSKSPAEQLFVEKCAMCHRQMGMGTVILARRMDPKVAMLEARQDLSADMVISASRMGIGNMPRITRGDVSDAQLAQLVVGVDLMETVLDAALGLLDGENLTPRPMPEPFGHSRFVIPEAPGRIVQADEGRVRELPGVHEVGFFHHAGQIAPPLWSASGRLGVLLMTATSDAELDARTADALAALNVIIEPMEPAAAATAWTEQIAREREGRA
jgi:cytochrome c553